MVHHVSARDGVSRAPPSPGESKILLSSKSQLSQSHLLSVNTTEFTMIIRAQNHNGHGTTSPRDAVVQTPALTAVPIRNNFDALTTDDDNSLDPGPCHNPNNGTKQTSAIDTMFHEADAKLAVEMYDFVLLEERLCLWLDPDLTLSSLRNAFAFGLTPT